MAGVGGRQKRKPVDYDGASPDELRSTCTWDPKGDVGVCRDNPFVDSFGPCDHIKSSPAFAPNTATVTIEPQLASVLKPKSPFVKAE